MRISLNFVESRYLVGSGELGKLGCRHGDDDTYFTLEVLLLEGDEVLVESVHHDFSLEDKTIVSSL